MYRLPFHESLMYGALISATDPVSVLAIFQVLFCCSTYVFAEGCCYFITPVRMTSAQRGPTIFTHCLAVTQPDKIGDAHLLVGYADVLSAYYIAMLVGRISSITGPYLEFHSYGLP